MRLRREGGLLCTASVTCAGGECISHIARGFFLSDYSSGQSRLIALLISVDVFDSIDDTAAAYVSFGQGK